MRNKAGVETGDKAGGALGRVSCATEAEEEMVHRREITLTVERRMDPFQKTAMTGIPVSS